jgi:hypothetical protein
LVVCYWKLKSFFCGAFFFTLPASNFLIYDHVHHCLRIKVGPEYTVKPQLCSRLKKQILELRTMRLQPYLWRFITSTLQPDTLTIPDNTLIKQFQQSLAWKTFQPRAFRISHINAYLFPIPNLSILKLYPTFGPLLWCYQQEHYGIEF